MPSGLLQTISQEMSDEDNQLLEMYHQSFNDDEVDVKLCLALIYHLHCRPDKGNLSFIYSTNLSVLI